MTTSSLTRLFRICLCFFALFLCSYAKADTVIIAHTEDLTAAQQYFQADTHLIVLESCTAREKKLLDALVSENKIESYSQMKFTAYSKYKAKELAATWKAGTKAYERLLTALRKDQCTAIYWYTDPETADLYAAVFSLLQQVCGDAYNPSVLGTEGKLQYGCRIQEMIQLVSGEVTKISSGEWLNDLQAKWSKDDLPEIPGMPELNPEGFSDGEPFIYEDEETGIWIYISDSLHITITRHAMQDNLKHVWFEADIQRKAGSDTFLHCHTGTTGKATINASDIAKDFVFACNADYHQYRISLHYPVGLIIRAGNVVQSSSIGTAGKAGMPNLDCMMLKSDGSMSVHPATTLTAEIAQEQNAYDVLSFGPILIQDGIWCQVNAAHHTMHDPRTAVGRLGENHYLVIFAEGRLPEARGMSLDELQEIFLARGATDAINLDGGRTSCLFFLGKQIGSVGNKTTAVSPRGQWEMLVIGDLSE